MKALAGLSLALLLSGCIVGIDGDNDNRTIRGSGLDRTEVREISSFDAVSFETQGTLFIATGDAESLRIEADDNLLDYIDTFVRNGTLHIEARDNVNLDPRSPIRIYLTVPDLTSLSVAGSGSVQIDSVISDQFAVAILGSGGVEIADVQLLALEASIAGSGNLTVAGHATTLLLSIVASGNFAGADLSASHASIAIEGSGSATTRISDTLNVSIVGSGHVRYYGSPQVSSSVVGSGTVTRLGD